MATLEFADYRRELLAELAALSPETDVRVDRAEARRNYRWDSVEVAELKFLLNFRLPVALRARLWIGCFPGPSPTSRPSLPSCT